MTRFHVHWSGRCHRTDDRDEAAEKAKERNGAVVVEQDGREIGVWWWVVGCWFEAKPGASKCPGPKGMHQ